MDLYDTLFNKEQSGAISVHELEAAVTEYATGHATRWQVVSILSMDSEAAADLDILLDALDALSTPVEKLIFMQEMQSVNIGHESKWPGYQTKGQYATRLGL